MREVNGRVRDVHVFRHESGLSQEFASHIPYEAHSGGFSAQTCSQQH